MGSARRTLKHLAGRVVGPETATRLARNVILLRVRWRRALRRLSSSPAPPAAAVQGFGDHDHHTFFGYYDLVPMSATGERLLACRVKRRGARPAADSMEVGWFQVGQEAGFRRAGATRAWCWQQTCRLRWHPSDPDLVMFNVFEDGRYAAAIHSAEDGTRIATLPRPLYAVDDRGRNGLSLNFSRLHRLRPGYGYECLPDATAAEAAPDDDGVWLMDLESGESELVLSLRRATEVEPSESMRGAQHYFNHLDFAPGGERYLVFHLWLQNGRRNVRILTCSLDGDVFVLADDGQPSHYDWVSDDRVVAYIWRSRGGDGYFLISDRSGERMPLGRDVLTVDGHPTYHPGRGLYLTDTYPDAYNDQHLMLFDPDSERVAHLGSFFRPFEYDGPQRCDLHPRWSPDGESICFDSAHEGYRRLYLMKVGEVEP